MRTDKGLVHCRTQINLPFKRNRSEQTRFFKYIYIYGMIQVIMFFCLFYFVDISGNFTFWGTGACNQNKQEGSTGLVWHRWFYFLGHMGRTQLLPKQRRRFYTTGLTQVTLLVHHKSLLGRTQLLPKQRRRFYRTGLTQVTLLVHHKGLLGRTQLLPVLRTGWELTTGSHWEKLPFSCSHWRRSCPSSLHAGCHLNNRHKHEKA